MLVKPILLLGGGPTLKLEVPTVNTLATSTSWRRVSSSDYDIGVPNLPWRRTKATVPTTMTSSISQGPSGGRIIATKYLE